MAKTMTTKQGAPIPTTIAIISVLSATLPET